MPTSATKKSSPKASIVLLTANKNLQNGLLADLIGKETGMACSVIHSTTNITKKAQLILLDCQDTGTEQLVDLAGQISQRAPQAATAIINAQNTQAHEDLLDWPHISGIFYADTDQAQLMQGIQCLLNGEYWVPRRLLHHLLDKNRKKPPTLSVPDGIKLTKRERQILKLIKDGATNADISESLKVTEHTVKSHLYNVYRKIGVRNRLEASNWVRNIQLDTA